MGLSSGGEADQTSQGDWKTALFSGASTIFSSLAGSKTADASPTGGLPVADPSRTATPLPEQLPTGGEVREPNINQTTTPKMDNGMLLGLGVGGVVLLFLLFR